MGDQPALVVDDIGVAGLADLDRGDDVPDQLEIDLGDRDPGIAAALRHRHRHVGLGFLAEIDRAEPHLLGERLGKAGIGRVIGAAAGHIHRQTGDLELLVALAVELDQLGDRRHLPLQSAEVEAALLDRRGGPLRRRRPADLPFDLGDELLDALRRRIGLFALQLDRRVPGLVIGEPDIERSVDQQHQADEPDQSGGIFRKKAPARTSPSAHAYLLPRRRRPGSLCRPPWSSVHLDGRGERHRRGFRCKPDISTTKTLSSSWRGRKATPALSMKAHRALLQLTIVSMIYGRCICSKSAAKPHPQVVLPSSDGPSTPGAPSTANLACELGNF